MEPNTIGENWIQLMRMCAVLGLAAKPLPSGRVQLPRGELSVELHIDLSLPDAVAHVVTLGAKHLHSEITLADLTKSRIVDLAIFRPYLEAE